MSPVGYARDSAEEVLQEARRSTQVTYLHSKDIFFSQGLRDACGQIRYKCLYQNTVMTTIVVLISLSRKLRLSHTYMNIDNIIFKAQGDKPTYVDFLLSVLNEDVKYRDLLAYERRQKSARLPQQHDLDDFDFKFSCGISKIQM